MCARLFTHGYELYASSRSWMKHCWSRKYRPNFRENMENATQDERRRITMEEEMSRKRVRQLLGMEQHESTAEQHCSTTAPPSTCFIFMVWTRFSSFVARFIFVHWHRFRSSFHLIQSSMGWSSSTAIQT